VLLVTWGNNTFVPRIVLIRGCCSQIPAPEWGFTELRAVSSELWAGNAGIARNWQLTDRSYQ